uniref:Secreted protein n=1 Tax=Anopheles darlingi TaxID=43151 RepID=A0A2M4D526_ANODA
MTPSCFWFSHSLSLSLSHSLSVLCMCVVFFPPASFAASMMQLALTTLMGSQHTCTRLDERISESQTSSPPPWLESAQPKQPGHCEEGTKKKDGCRTSEEIDFEYGGFFL